MQKLVKEENLPLVTVGIVTYNSAKTILETLESAKSQTYQNIELVISDDASTDNTIELCREWIEKNADRFVRTEILTVSVNTGIPGNCNREIAAARGEYLKSIAGDDILLPNCVEDYVAFMQENPEAQIAFSRVKEFCRNASEREFFELHPDEKNRAYFKKSAWEQFEAFVKEKFWVPAPSCFVKTALLKQNPYNEYYPAMEDLPQWCKLTRAGTRLYFMDKLTVLYRVNSASVSTTQNENFYSVPFMESRKLFFICELRNYLKELDEKKQIRKYEREFLLFDFVMFAFKNKKTGWTSFWKHMVSRILKML